MQRIELISDKTPNFIGGWFLDKLHLCQDIIDFFEHNSSLQEAGMTAHGLDRSTKNSTDIKIYPKDLQKPTHKVLVDYIQELYRCYIDYLQQWPFLMRFLKEVDIGTFNIQKYNVGGHFSNVHSERTSPFTMHRVLVWMTYLNDVEDGGHTQFVHYELDVKPERGKTLIWPVDWTHAHAGKVVTMGSKYIITGWMHFSLVRQGIESEIQVFDLEVPRT